MWAGSTVSLRALRSPVHTEARVRELLHNNGATVGDTTSTNTILVVDSFESVRIRRLLSFVCVCGALKTWFIPYYEGGN